MAKITVDISDPIHKWLNNEADNRGVSPDQFVAGCLLAQRSKLMPSHNEVHLLEILQNVTVRLGWAVPARSLWTIWGIRGRLVELDVALRGLTGKGFVEPAPNGNGYALTELGFQFPASVESAISHQAA